MNRTFDRLVEFDPRSRSFPIRSLVAGKPPRSYSWRCYEVLDQGAEGACVGFAWTHELAARPAVWPVTDQMARTVYREAQKVDQWPGENYEGTSVLAGAKVITDGGYMAEYRWAFGLDDLILALGYAGPAVLGINWYSGMFQPDDKGFLHVRNGLAGGHAILANGVNIRGEYVKVHNSWGWGWGDSGQAKISFDDMRRLLSEDGEACIPVKRIRPPKR